MIIFEFIAQVFVELIFEGLILGFFKLVRKLGIVVLRVITFSKLSFKELDQEYYKDSMKPYFIGLVIIITFGYLLFF